MIYRPQPVPPEPPLVRPQPIKLLFTGDLSFDRHIRDRIAEHDFSWPLQELTQFFQSFDLVIINLESPITANPSVSQGSIPGEPRNFSFTSAPETAPALAAANIRLVNLGNNHTLNFGLDGLAQTKNYLTQVGIDYFDSGQPLIKTINRLNLGFVNYNQFITGGLEAALEDLTTLRPQVDVLIAVCHWGEEYQSIAAPAIQVLARQFIDLGADLVIGGHPHVIQQQELYQGQPIYYSLGNFVFDQYFSPETRKGLLVSATIDPENLNSLQTQEFYVDILPTGQTVLSQ